MTLLDFLVGLSRPSREHWNGLKYLAELTLSNPVSREIRAYEIPLLRPCQPFCRYFCLQGSDHLPCARDIGLVGALASANSLTRSEPVLELLGNSARPLSISRPASC
jgi:hypothetical protein